MTRSAYLPIRPTGYKPSPAPYWNELNNAQSLVGIGSVGLLSQVPNIVDNSNSLLSNTTAQDVINNHLNRDVSDSGTGYIFTPPTGEIVNTNTPLTVPQYKTYDESFVTPKMAEIDQGFVPPDMTLQDEGFSTPNVENMGILYQKEEPVMKDGILGEYPEGSGMVVIHNTGASAIQNYDKIGGMPKPSLAVASENIDEMKFGEITLVGDPELMIPSKNNPVYKGDAYTQRYPLVRTIYSDNEMDQIIDYFSDIFEVDDIRRDYSKISDFKFQDGSKQVLFYAGDLYNQIINNGINNLPGDMLDIAFLKEKGLLPDFNLAKDKYEYKRLLDQVFTPELNAEFKKWNNSLAERIGVEGKEKIVAGHTPSGKTRYKDHTLDNVLQHMSNKAGTEEGFGSTSIGNLASIMRGKFKNKKELAAARDSLVSESEMNDIQSELYDELSQITDLLVKENKHLDQNSFSTGDNFIKVFGDPKYTIEQNFREFYPTTTDATKQKVKSFLKKLANTPSEYFEIKPNRALQMNEFKGAIVPMDTDEKTIQILLDNGIKIKRYNTEKDRLDKLKEFEDLFASMPVNPLFNYA